VNTSATLPGRLAARRADGVTVPLHWSTTLDDGDWVVELRRPDNRGPDLGVEPGTRLALPGGVEVTLIAGHPDPFRPSRLWRARTDPPVPVTDYLRAHGAPIGYGYLRGNFPLADFQTVYATEPGSAEMPSAARAFTADLVVELVAAGVELAPIVLHTGVSSPETGEPPFPEWFRVPEATARHVNAVHAGGGRVVAVGTTAVRALETAADAEGTVTPSEGWTELVIDEHRGVHAVDGLLTGWHAPEATHIDLVRAIAGRDIVERCYAAAAAGRYLWHEFGDLNLLLR